MWNDIKIGDIITAYHKGYHKVTQIERRFFDKRDLQFDVYKNQKVYNNQKVGDELSPLIHYVRIATASGKHVYGPKQSCDYTHCQNAQTSIKGEIKRLQDIMGLLSLL